MRRLRSDRFVYVQPKAHECPVRLCVEQWSTSKKGDVVKRLPVRSSNIRAIGFDPETRTLEVEFHNGGVYQYSGVPESIYQGLVRAASKGSYLHNHIKGKYPFRQVR